MKQRQKMEKINQQKVMQNNRFLGTVSQSVREKKCFRVR